jgi:hypothetical protein
MGLNVSMVGMKGHSLSIAIRSATGRAIAHVEPIEGSLTLTKEVRATKHFLRQPPAIAFDAAAIGQAKALGAVSIVVVDSETGRRYSSSMDQFQSLAIDIDRGHGRQLALPLPFWQSPGGATAPESSPPAQTVLPFMEAA